MATFPLIILTCFPSVCLCCRHPCFISGEWLSCQIGSYLTGSDLLLNWIQNMKYSKYGEQRDLPNYPHISIIFQTHTTHRRNVNMHEYWTHAHLHTDTRTYTLLHTYTLNSLHIWPQWDVFSSSSPLSNGLSFTNVQTGFKEFNFVMGSTTCFQKFSQNCLFRLFLQNRCRHRKVDWLSNYNFLVGFLTFGRLMCLRHICVCSCVSDIFKVRTVLRSISCETISGYGWFWDIGGCTRGEQNLVIVFLFGGWKPFGFSHTMHRNGDQVSTCQMCTYKWSLRYVWFSSEMFVF